MAYAPEPAHVHTPAEQRPVARASTIMATPLPPSAARMLALQRSAGNRVALMMWGRGATAPAGARHGVDPNVGAGAPMVVQRLVTQIVPKTKEPRVIDAVLIIGRPERVFGSSMGDHTTAFAVQLDSVRRRLEGRTYEEAVAVVDELVKEMSMLPGASEYAALDPAYERKFSAAFDRLKALRRAIPLPAPDAGEGAAAEPSTALLVNLQEYVNAYLNVRELVPFSVINVAASVPALAGKGKGEAGWVEVLASHERGMAQEPALLQEAIRRVFDPSAVGLAVAEQVPEMLARIAPGLNPKESIEDRFLKYVRQHLAAIAAAFPTAAKDSGLSFEAARAMLVTDVTPWVKKHLSADRDALVKNLAGRTGQLQRLRDETAHGTPSQRKKARQAVKDEEIEHEGLAHRIKAMDDMLKAFAKEDAAAASAVLAAAEGEKPEGARSGESAMEVEATTGTKRKRGAEDAGEPERAEGDDDAHAGAEEAEAAQAKKEDEEEEEEDRRQPLATQIVLDDAGLITELRSGGRSPSPFPGTMGAHSTAWIVHVDRIRRAIQGKSVRRAVRILNNVLVPEATRMKDDLASIKVKPKHKELLLSAEIALTDIQESIRGTRGVVRLGLLQLYVNRLLTYINFLPGATWEAGDTAGKGEGALRGVLVEHEDGVVAHTKLELRTAILKLLDVHAAPAESQMLLFRNHLEIIEKTYPKAYKASGVADLLGAKDIGSVLAELGEKKRRVLKAKRRGTKPQGAVEPEVVPPVGEAEEDFEFPWTADLFAPRVEGADQGPALVDLQGTILPEQRATFIAAYRADAADSSAYLAEAEGHALARRWGIGVTVYRGGTPPPGFSRVENPGGGHCLIHALAQVRAAAADESMIAGADSGTIRQARRDIAQYTEEEYVLPLCIAAVMARVYGGGEPGLGPEMRRLLDHVSVRQAALARWFAPPPPAGDQEKGKEKEKAPAPKREQAGPPPVQMPMFGDRPALADQAVLHTGGAHYVMIVRDPPVRH